MTEADLTKKIVKKLKAEGAFAVKIHGGPNQQRGLPDIVGCEGGQFFGLEVKRPGKESTVTPLQAKKLRDIDDAGGITAVVTTVGQALEAVYGYSS